MPLDWTAPTFEEARRNGARADADAARARAQADADAARRKAEAEADQRREAYCDNLLYQGVDLEFLTKLRWDKVPARTQARINELKSQGISDAVAIEAARLKLDDTQAEWLQKEMRRTLRELGEKYAGGFMRST